MAIEHGAQQDLVAPTAPDFLVRSYARHEAAEEAVDRLADHHFPVQHLAIVGRNIALLERVTGRAGYTRLALIGAILGVFAGAILGSFIFPLWLTIPGMVVGGVIGAMLGAGERALHSSHHFSAEIRHGSGRYALMADTNDAAEQARRILAESESEQRF